MEPGKDNRSLSSLFNELSREMSALFRQEIALARAEVDEKVAQARSGVALLVAGGLVVLVGLFFLVQAAVFGVAAILEIWLDGSIVVWLAPLLVAIVAALIGWAVLSGGLRKVTATSPVPRRTVESLRRDKDLAEEHVR